MTCPVCNGSKTIDNKPCGVCNGNGEVSTAAEQAAKRKKSKR